MTFMCKRGHKEGQKNVHSPASLNEHRGNVHVLFFHPSLLKPSQKHPYRREAAWHQGRIGFALYCFSICQDENEFSNIAWDSWLAYRCLLPPTLFFKAATVSILEAKLAESWQVEFDDQIPSSKRSIDCVEIVGLGGVFFLPEIGKGSN